MKSTTEGDDNAKLDAIFRAYREAVPDPEVSANFMPDLWRRIEERQRSVFFLGRWARTLVTAAAVLSLGMAAYLYIPQGHNSVFSAESYVEALAAGHAQDNPDLPEPAVDEL
jgi:UDP-N-acetyl-D-mannosaminuronic acid transferase (WecB/TagA/CpsF family)